MNENKKLAINSSIIFARLCIVSVIGLLCSRLVLEALGASDFGLYSVVGGIVILLSVVNTAMVSASYRYIAYELGKGEDGNPNKVFNTSLVIHGCFALLILAIGLTIGEWYIDNYLNVPQEKLDDAHFVFIISLVTTSLSTFMVPFQGLLVAYERFGTNALIDIVSYIIRITLIVFLLGPDKGGIRMYSIIMMIFTVFTNLCYLYYCFSKFRATIKIKIYDDKTLYMDMLSYGGWSMFGIGAYMLKSQGSNIVINFFFGTIINAAYAVANQVESFIIAFARSLNSAATPQITKNYSGGNESRFFNLACYVSKYSFLLMSLVAFPVLLEIDFLLGLWLHEVPAGASVFCSIMVVEGLCDCIGDGITPMFQANGNIKKYQIIIHSVLLLGIPVSAVLYYFGAAPYTIVIVYACISLTNAFLKLMLLNQILHYNSNDFFKKGYLRILILVIPLVAYYLVYTNLNLTTTISHIVGFIVSEIYLLVCIFLICLDNKEKFMIKSFVLSKVKSLYGREK